MVGVENSSSNLKRFSKNVLSLGESLVHRTFPLLICDKKNTNHKDSILVALYTQEGLHSD